MNSSGEPFAPQGAMLRFDRYLVAPSRSHTMDLATGSVVHLDHPAIPGGHTAVRALFSVHHGRTLIDCEPEDDRRIEIWERWISRRRPPQLEVDLRDFVEMLECARHGSPRACPLGNRHGCDHGLVVRAFAREARVRGWVPIAVELLAAVSRRRRNEMPAWLVDRSLVIFVPVDASLDDLQGLHDLAGRDARPHVLVTTSNRRRAAPPWFGGRRSQTPVVLSETRAAFGGVPGCGATDGPDSEAAARWAWLIAGVTGSGDRARRAIELADVLVAREQPFEARAVLATVAPEASELVARQAAVVDGIRQRALETAACRLAGDGTAAQSAWGYDMVDDFVDVLRICQDIEDEQTALARVGAFLRDRLQAASVAFVVREGASPRVLARVGSETAGVGMAVRSIETGVPINPARDQGPVECAWPVRHAAEVIGAVWCRWSTGTHVATQHASTLLGIAAAATAPSLRLAIARAQPIADRTNPVPELIGDSLAMVAVREAIVRAAASPFPVVIEGESGSGKELAARAIHARSVRRDRSFCAINCAALVDDLVEAELFGHVRGAFTGAASDRRGVFEEANGGTLFLDEVAELGSRVQAKLLRTLQEGEIRRVGENTVRKIDVRILAATNRPLAGEVTAGAFRADLWYRLDVVRISLPPLRERIEDLPSLVHHLWRLLAARTGSRAALSAASVAALAAYAWPGNIRELQNVLASMLVSAPRSGFIGPSALPLHIARAAALERRATLADARRQFEERYVRAALAKAGGKTAAAARDLGLSRQGLSKLMGRLGIDDGRSESAARPNVQ
jgi:DNA-binding NtrC family response regulator